MKFGTPLIVGPNEIAALTALRETAENDPVQVQGLKERIATPDGKRAHMDRMDRQTIKVPMGFMVTYSLEIGHPGGKARHMSMSSPVAGRIPSPYALWMICKRLGFTGSLKDCIVWKEDLQRGEEKINAVNVVQFL